jgi:hypothetical protein
MSVDASLLPKPHGDDPEDVAWALSTAEALWKRGEYHDAVSWIRKAATAASEADKDLRVIELAKAAAELAALVEAFGEKPKRSKPPSTAPDARQPIEVEVPKPVRMPALSDPDATLDAPRSAPKIPAAPARPQETFPKPMPESDLIETSIELDVDPVTMSMEPAAPEPPKHAPPRKPPGPPPRATSAKPPAVAITEAAPVSTTIVHSGVAHSPLSLGSSTGVGPSVVTSVAGLARSSVPMPTPNPMPSPLQPMIAAELEVPIPDDPIFEEAVSPASVRNIDSRRPPAVREDLDEDSLPRVPTVPPAPPDDFHPTPLRMRAAPVAKIPEPTAGRLRTPISLAPALDVRAENRDAVAVGPAIDVRGAARTNEITAPEGSPAAAPPQPPAPPQVPRPGAPRLATIRSHPPAPPSVPPPRTKPGSIPPPRPLSQRPPAPPAEPLELDLSERSSIQRGKLPKSNVPSFPSVTETQVGLPHLAPPSVTETQEGLPHLAPPSVTETQQGLGVDMPKKHPSSDALPAPTVLETQKGLAAKETPKPASIAPPPARPASILPPPKPASEPPSSFDVLKDPRPPVMSTPAPRGGVRSIDSARFEALADVPDDEREKILGTGEMMALLPDEETDAPAIVIVLHGELEVRVRGRPSTLEIITVDQVRLLAPTKPCDGDLIVVGGKKGARILALPHEAIEMLRAAAPWVAQDLEPSSDDLHVVAGALRGEMGRRLDDALLREILGCAETMRLAPGAIVVKNQELVRALVVLGAGALSLRVADAPDAQEIGALEPGEVLFPSELLSRTAAPSTVRAGPDGAVVLVATRAATEELLVTYPPLLEILGEG